MKKLIVSLGLLLGLFASAQNYSIDWYKIAGGGGVSTSAVYTVSGTIGQHDAGGPMIGGSYSLFGGFWSLYCDPDGRRPGATHFPYDDKHCGRFMAISFNGMAPGAKHKPCYGRLGYSRRNR